MAMTRLRFKSALVLPAALASGCIAVPDAPQSPSLELASPSTFDHGEGDGLAAMSVAGDWWRTFDDPMLGDLVTAALEQNRDLDVALADIHTARARLVAEGLERTMSTYSSASAEFGQAPRDGADAEFSGSGQFGASWEYDAFGRIDALVAAAAAGLDSEIELQRDLAVTVAANTALAYAELRGSQVRLTVARSNAELQGDSLALLRTLFENGRATRLDLERAESQFRTTLASVPQIEARMRIAAANLVTLTGQTSLSEIPLVERALAAPGAIPGPPNVLAVETPVALIRRRPDVRAAEAEIAQLLALGEADRARLFPTLTFNANLLSLFNETNDIGDSFGFGIGPAIRWEGPDLRRVRADIDVSDARTRRAIENYERIVVEALGEVETALIGYAFERARRADLEAAAASAERATSLARLRFEEGVDDFLDVIDAQRAQLDAQDRLEISRLETTRQAIFAYRALGGIWSAEQINETRATGDTPNG